MYTYISQQSVCRDTKMVFPCDPWSWQGCAVWSYTDEPSSAAASRVPGLGVHRSQWLYSLPQPVL